MKSVMFKIITIISLLGTSLVSPINQTESTTSSTENNEASSASQVEQTSTSLELENSQRTSEQSIEATEISESQIMTDDQSSESAEETTASPESTTATASESSEIISSEEETTRLTPEDPIDSWDALNQALQDASMATIYVDSDLVATKNITVNRKVAIDFRQESGEGNHRVNFGTYAIILGPLADVSIANLSFEGKGTAFRGNGTNSVSTGKLTFQGEILSLPKSSELLANIPGGTITFAGAYLKYTNTLTSPYALDSKNLMITNESIIDSDGTHFFHSGNSADAGGIVSIDGGSQIYTTYSLGSNEVSGGQIWTLTNTKELNISGKNTSFFAGTSAGSDGIGADGAVVFGDASNNKTAGNINITNNASVTISSEISTGLYFNSGDGVITVDNASLEVKQARDDPRLSSFNTAVRFGPATNQMIKTYRNAHVAITKSAGQAAALRFTGTTNQVVLYSGSNFLVSQLEEHPLKSIDDAMGQAVVVSSTNGSPETNFYAAGEDTNLRIKSLGGAAIYSTSNGQAYGQITVRSDDGSYLTLAGHVSNHPGSGSRKEGVLESGTTNVYVANPKYYDIKNTNGTRGQLFVGGSFSIISSLEAKSDVAFWKNDWDVAGPATYNWSNTSFRFSTTGLKLTYTNNKVMENVFKTTDLSQYSRIRTTNSELSARLDQIREATDADQAIFVHASLLEGKEGEARDAEKDEIQATIEVTAPTGEKNTFTATVADTQDIYEDQGQKGWLKFPYLISGKQAYLPAGATIKIVTARLNDGIDTNGNIIWTALPAANISNQPTTVYDATPPEVLTSKISSFSPNKKSIAIAGTPGSLVTGAINGKIIPEIKTQIDSVGQGVVTLPGDLSLKTGDKLQLFASDTSGLLLVKHPPLTNNRTGNINPSSELVYHDRVFKAALVIEVSGSLELVSVPDLDFGTNMVVSDTSVIRPQINRSLEIKDTRGFTNNSVTLSVSLKDPLMLGPDSLVDELKYINATGQEVVINQTPSMIGQFSHFENEMVSDNWNETKGADARGFIMKLPPEKQRKGSFSGTLQWVLSDIPENE